MTKLASQLVQEGLRRVGQNIVAEEPDAHDPRARLRQRDH